MTKDYIRIYDTTLRDGEQTPGVSLTLEDKMQIAESLSELGVDIIEAGFPQVSKGECRTKESMTSVFKFFWDDSKEVNTWSFNESLGL